MKHKVFLSFLCSVFALGLITGCKNNNLDSNIDENNKLNENIIQNGSSNNNSVKGTKYEVYTADYPKEKRNIDYYWNINTETFDKTRFDGKISFFGNVLNSKITGKTLTENGFSLSEITYYTCNDIFHIDDEIEKDYVQKCGQLTNQNKSYPIDFSSVGVPTLINFDKNDNYSSDNVEIYFEYNKTNDYIDFVTETEESNIIFPYFNGIKYDELTIDLIIENMGVPTYVADRTTADGYSLSLVYYYVYNDYVFKFDFVNIGKKVKYTGVTYMGTKTFNHSYIDYLYYDPNNEELYKAYNLKEKLDEEYKTYISSINN